VLLNVDEGLLLVSSLLKVGRDLLVGLPKLLVSLRKPILRASVEWRSQLVPLGYLLEISTVGLSYLLSEIICLAREIGMLGGPLEQGV
jgi:hypothetical protein